MAVVTVLLLIVLGCMNMISSDRPDPMNQMEGKCGCCPKPCCCHCIVKEKKGNEIFMATTSSPFGPACMDTLDLGFCVDTSDINEVDNLVQNQFIMDILQTLPIGPSEVRVAIVTSGTNAAVQFGFSSPIIRNTEALNAAIFNIPTTVGDNTPECLEKLADLFTERAGRVAVVFMNSPVDTRKSDLEEAARKLQEKVDSVVVIGITTDVIQSELETVATGPGNSNVLEGGDFESLESLIHHHIQTICPQRPTGRPVEQTEEECFCCCPPPPGISDSGYAYGRRLY